MTNYIYDFPLYYDILFGWDRSAEADFYHRVFDGSGIATSEPVLEVACGTGRIATQLASLGRKVVGLDINADMLAFLAARAKAERMQVRTIRADMRTFSNDSAFGAAYNPMSSFRLLRSNQEAESHLNGIARTLRKGGVYVLDMTFRAGIDDDAITTDEVWEMSREGVAVRATNQAIYVNDHGRSIELRWGDGEHLRNYTWNAFVDLVAHVPGLEIESCHPEVGRTGDDGASTFDAENPSADCAPGRAMIVLRRVS